MIGPSWLRVALYWLGFTLVVVHSFRFVTWQYGQWRYSSRKFR